MAKEVTDQEWTEYKTKFNKTYKDETEEQMRRERYSLAKVKVEEHNKRHEEGHVTYSMALNHLSDATDEEMAMRCGKKVPPK